MHTRYLLWLFVFFLPLPAAAQLVNIESRRMQEDSTRFAFQSNVSGSFTDINGSTIFQTSPSLSTQFKTADLTNVVFLTSYYRLLRTDEKDISNVWLVHLRYNRKVTPALTLEAFVQNQHDAVLAIESRRLAGAGVRVPLLSRENTQIYLGNAYLYEREEANFVDEIEYHHRNSSYLTLSARLPESSVTLTNTFYYQPLYEDLGDYRILEQFKANVSLSGKISLFVVFDYYYDSITPEDMRQFSSTTSAGLGIDL